MADKEFANGIIVKTVDTKYGQIIKLSINKESILNNPYNERGWVNIDQLVTNASEFTRENLIDIVKTDNKQRYSISSDGTKIRANQGHSINVNLDLEEKQPPDVLYHGTVERFLKSINEEGLKKLFSEC